MNPIDFFLNKLVKQKIHLYTLCWNEEKILPFFFQHYDALVNQYFIYDHHSTDGSQQLLNSHPRVSWETFDLTEDSFVDHARKMYDDIWKQSRGKADWVIVCNVDELFYHPHLLKYLNLCREQNITIILPEGYDMQSDEFPQLDRPLNDQVRSGARNTALDKAQLFNPNKIIEINFSHGRHTVHPIGKVKWPPTCEVKLLHYKFLGLGYVCSRYDELQQRMKSKDLEQGWGVHYSKGYEETAKKYFEIKEASVNIF